MSKRLRKIKAEPLIETSSVPMETYPGVGYEPDNSVHAPKVPDVGRPKNPDQGFLKEPEGNAVADDMVLTQPMRYIVDPKDAIERMEALNRKVEESRPELAPQIAVVDEAIQQLEQASQGKNVAPAPEAQPEVPAFSEGDRVSVTLEDGVYEGMVEKANDDGTFAVRTDQAMTLQNVPATSMQKAEVEQMMLPASLLLRLKAARMVTDAIAKAFIDGKKRRIANTSTDGKTVWLHNNAIARKAGDGSIEISLAGWPTVTTRERINGLLSALGIDQRVSQKGGSQMLNGKPWDGEWLSVGKPMATSTGPEVAEGPADVDKNVDLAASFNAEEEEALEEEGPAPEDYTITPSGELGSKLSVGQVEGDFLGEFAEWADAAKAIRDKMEADQFWPGVWFISDHGNVEPADIRASTQIEAMPEKGGPWYIGHKGGNSEAFQSENEPTPESHPNFGAVTGPFRSERGARYGAGYKGPVLQTVDEFEEAAHREPSVKAEELSTEVPATEAPATAKQWFVVERKWSDGNDARSDADVLVEAANAEDAIDAVGAMVRADFKTEPDDEGGEGLGDLWFEWYHDTNDVAEGEPGYSEENSWLESYMLTTQGPFATEEEARKNTSKFHGTPLVLEAGMATGTGEGRLEMVAGKKMGKKPGKKLEAKVKAEADAKRVKAAEAKPTNTAQTGTETGKVKEGYEPTGIQVVEEGGKPRAFDQAKDDVVPAELYKNAEGKLALVNPNGENSYEEGANDELELAYWASVKALAPSTAPAAEAKPEPAKTTEAPAQTKEAVAASAKATATAAREKIKASKKAKSEVKASAFDEIGEIEIGGGYKAKRKPGKEKKDGEEPEASEIEVVDADGKVKATYPDAFGDDTVMIIKFLRQVLDIKEGDDKKAAKKEGGASKEGGESDIAEKPKALPATKEEKPKSETEKEEEQVQARRIEARLEDIRAIATRLLKTGHIQANLDDVDAGLVKGLTLAGAQAAAATKAVDRKVLDLLAQPEDELLLIKASLPLLPDRRVTVQASGSGLAPINLSAAGVVDVSGDQNRPGLGAAFGRGFRR